MNEKLRLINVQGYAAFVAFCLVAWGFVFLALGGLLSIYFLGLWGSQPYVYLFYACLFVLLFALIFFMAVFSKAFNPVSTFFGAAGDIVEGTILSQEEARKELYEAGHRYVSNKVPAIPALVKVGRDRLVLQGNVLSPFGGAKAFTPGQRVYVFYSPLKISKGVVVYGRGAFGGLKQ